MQVGEIALIQREQMREVPEVARFDLAGAVKRNVNAVAQRRRLRAAVGWIADMPVAGSRRFDLDIQPGLLRRLPEGRFGQGRAADIAQADEEDGRAAGRRHECGSSSLCGTVHRCNPMG